ncbi:MAG: hypothetical protein ACT4RN_21810 [Pseudonocardia sp.]
MPDDRDLRSEIARQDAADLRAPRNDGDGPPDGAADRVWLAHARALGAARRPGGRVGLPAKVAMVLVAAATVLLGGWAYATGHGTTFGLFAMFGGPVLLVVFLAAAAVVKLFRGGW